MGGINKREHLIKTGQELIWSKGYDLCSIKDITNAAGLPKGSFYHYFESKEKFALEAMREFIESHPEKTTDHKFTLKTLEKLIDNRIDSIINIQFARECYMSVMCHAYTEQEDDFRQQVVASINQSNETMRSLLKELKAQGLLRENLDLEELEEFIDFSWRGARLKARILKSDQPLKVFKKYLIQFISPH
jgi:TetR/AcrR family transcriptional repressor of nem operon